MLKQKRPLLIELKKQENKLYVYNFLGSRHKDLHRYILSPYTSSEIQVLKIHQNFLINLSFEGTTPYSSETQQTLYFFQLQYVSN